MSWRRKSYEAIPALSVRRQHLRQSLRTVTFAWTFGVVWLSCISGSHVKILATMLGFNDLAFGIMSALPFVATLAQLAASLLIERTGLLKYQFIYYSAIHRLLWLAVAVVPLTLPIPSTLAVTVFLLILTASWIMAAMGSPAWVTWMGCLIPRRIRGRYFGHRGRIALAVQTITVLSLGLLMDVVHTSDGGAAAGGNITLWVICSIFALAAVFGTVDILLFQRVPEVLPPPSEERASPAAAARLWADGQSPPPALRRGGLWRFLTEPLRDRLFRNYVLFGATVTFSATVAGWYLWLDALETLRFSNFATNALFLVIGPVAGIAASKTWGNAIDRWGRRPILMVATSIAILSLVPWFLAGPGTPNPAFVVKAVNWLLCAVGGLFGRGEWLQLDAHAPVGAYLLCAVGCILGGTAWTGIGLAQIGIVLGFADGKGQSRYVAASAVLTSVGGALGGVVGGVITQSFAGLQGHPLQWGPFLWNNWHLALFAAVLARAIAMFCLVRMPDPGSATVRTVLRRLGANVYSNARTRLFYPLRIFGWRRMATRGKHDDSGEAP